jgi:hypothetical protein
MDKPVIHSHRDSSVDHRAYDIDRIRFDSLTVKINLFPDSQFLSGDLLSHHHRIMKVGNTKSYGISGSGKTPFEDGGQEPSRRRNRD